MVTSMGATAKRSKELKKAASCRRRKPLREAPFGACCESPPLSSTRRLLLYEFRSTPRSASTLRAPSPCAWQSGAAAPYAPKPALLGRVSMECTNGQADLARASRTEQPEYGLKVF